MSSTILSAAAVRSGEDDQSPGQTSDNPGPVSDHRTQVNPPQAIPEEVSDRKKKVKWPPMNDQKAWREFDEDISGMLENTLRGTSKRKLEVMGDLIHEFSEVRFGLVEPRKQSPAPTPSRRQKEISRLRRELRSLRQRWKVAEVEERPGLEELRENVRTKLSALRRAEAQRVKRKKRDKARRSFFENPHKFTKKLFEQSKSGELNIPKQNLEDHIKEVYSDHHRESPMPEFTGLVRPSQPGVMFDVSEPKLSEVTRFINKARAASAPGPNGIPYKVYKKCEALRKYLWRLLKVVWRQDLVPLAWSEGEGVYIPKEENSSTLDQFPPIALLNVEGKIMFRIVAERLSSGEWFDQYISPEGRDTRITWMLRAC